MNGDGETALTAALRRDRLVVGSALALLSVIAWLYLVWLARALRGPADEMGGMAMSPGHLWSAGFSPWTVSHAAIVFAMWAVMMVGMMTPSASPMVLLYAQVARQARTLGRVFAPAGWFAAGYLLAWTGFAALAALAQYGLERAAVLSPMAQVGSHYAGGAILVAAGLYQLAPLKHACLAHCRAPLRFVQQHGGFRPDAGGSLRLGFLHGLYCVGCCWALMTLLFVGGVMNPLWIAVIAIVVLGEKVLPGGAILARLAGLAAIAAGISVMLR